MAKPVDGNPVENNSAKNNPLEKKPLEKTPLEKNKVPEPISIGEAFIYWLKLGFISFGGPAGQISMMH